MDQMGANDQKGGNKDESQFWRWGNWMGGANAQSQGSKGERGVLGGQNSKKSTADTLNLRCLLESK